jgi:hypothetical protein
VENAVGHQRNAKKSSGWAVVLVSSALIGAREMPKLLCMKSCRRLSMLAVALAGAAVLAGCGTPATVQPTATPLPGFKRDIQAAHNAVAQTEQQASSAAAANP